MSQVKPITDLQSVSALPPIRTNLFGRTKMSSCGE
jgi:hypothetical protein